MSLDKKGFAKLVENAIEELYVTTYNNPAVNKDDRVYKYNKCMKKLIRSKMNRLYSILSLPAYSRIMSVSNKELEEYRSDKLSELESSINRLMLAMEVSYNNSEKTDVKEKIEVLVEEQTRFREMNVETLRKYLIDKLNIVVDSDNESFDGKEETLVLENIIKDDNTISDFLSMQKEYSNLEREIKTIRAEQVIVYNDLLNNNIKGEISIDELFDENSLTDLQKTISQKITEISDLEINIKNHFGSKAKKMYSKLLSNEYKDNLNVLPYENGLLDVFEEMIPSSTIELARLQNEEWCRLNKKVFKTIEVSTTMAMLSDEIDDTKELINSYIREWYKNAYYNNSLFGPISSRASGKFEYSLGAKTCLCDFISSGIWPSDRDVDDLKLCLRLNRVEAEKSVIYAEQIKERLSRLFTNELNKKKEELSNLEDKINKKYGNWNNETILSIINEIK